MHPHQAITAKTLSKHMSAQMKPERAESEGDINVLQFIMKW